MPKFTRLDTDLTNADIPHPKSLERPNDETSAVWLRWTALGSGTGFYTLHDSYTDALAGEDGAGVAGSPDPGNPHRWPFSNNPPFTPDTTGWVLITDQPTAPTVATGYVVWSWGASPILELCARAKSILAEYTGSGQALEGFQVACGPFGELVGDKTIRLVPGPMSIHGADLEADLVQYQLKLMITAKDLTEGSSFWVVLQAIHSCLAVLHGRQAELDPELVRLEPESFQVPTPPGFAATSHIGEATVSLYVHAYYRQA